MLPPGHGEKPVSNFSSRPTISRKPDVWIVVVTEGPGTFIFLRLIHTTVQAEICAELVVLRGPGVREHFEGAEGGWNWAGPLVHGGHGAIAAVPHHGARVEQAVEGFLANVDDNLAPVVIEPNSRCPAN